MADNHNPKTMQLAVVWVRRSGVRCVHGRSTRSVSHSWNFPRVRVWTGIGRQRPLINNNKSFETLRAAFPRLATAVMNFRGCRDGDRKPPDLGVIANSKRQLTRCVLNAWPIFRARHDTVICEMWPVCCPTWESVPCAQSTRGGITTEVALYIWSTSRSRFSMECVVTNAGGIMETGPGESLQHWPWHEVVVPQASRTTDARFLGYSRRNPSPRRVSGGQSTPPRHGKLALRCFSVPESRWSCPGSCACQRP